MLFRSSDFADHARRVGAADDAALQRIADGWHEWSTHPDGWLLMPHGTLLARGAGSVGIVG